MRSNCAMFTCALAAFITSTFIACTGPAGHNGPAIRIRTSPIEAGATCPNGGTLLEYGVDDGAGTSSGNGELDNDEVEGSTPICYGATGPIGETGDAGHDSLIAVDATVGSACSAFGNKGGQRVRAGTDDGVNHDNGILEDDEVDAEKVICNGATGAKGDTGSAAQTCTVVQDDDGTGTIVCPNGTMKVLRADGPGPRATYFQGFSTPDSQTFSGSYGTWTAIPGRTMSFTTAIESGGIRLTYRNVAAVYTSGSPADPRCLWRVLANGVPCGLTIESASTVDSGRGLTVFGVCEGQSKGTHVDVTVEWMQMSSGFTCVDGNASLRTASLEASELGN